MRHGQQDYSAFMDAEPNEFIPVDTGPTSVTVILPTAPIVVPVIAPGIDACVSTNTEAIDDTGFSDGRL
jgi:hypothetical protein